MRVRVDTRRDAQKYFLLYARFCRSGVDGVKLFGVIRREEPYAAFYGVRDIGIGLVVAVEHRVRKVEPRGVRRVKFARRNDIGAHTLGADYAVNLFKAERFGSEHRARAGRQIFAHSLHVFAAARADAVFVHYERGRAEFAREFDGIGAGEIQTPVFADF